MTMDKDTMFAPYVPPAEDRAMVIVVVGNHSYNVTVSRALLESGQLVALGCVLKGAYDWIKRELANRN